MNLFAKLFSTTAALLLVSTSLSLAAVDTQALVSDLQAQGYTRIEVKTGVRQVKVEAIRGTEKVEVVYDKSTGAVLKSQTEAVRRGEDISAGVSYDTHDDDFVDDNRRVRGDSGDSYDDSDGRSDDRDDDSDDDRGDDSGDDRGDDKGGDRGGDDNGGDRGGDDNGGDRGGDDNGGDRGGNSSDD